MNTRGSFLGECIVRVYGGHWTERKEGWCVQFDVRNAVFPCAKIAKQLENGKEDSVLAMLSAIPFVFKLQRGNVQSAVEGGPKGRACVPEF